MRLVSGVIGLAIWETTWFIAYIVISSPFAAVIASVISGGSGTYAENQLIEVGANISLAFGVAFVIAMLGGILWFILWISRREYEQETYRF